MQQQARAKEVLAMNGIHGPPTAKEVFAMDRIHVSPAPVNEFGRENSLASITTSQEGR
jgi:hypothetical protein